MIILVVIVVGAFILVVLLRAKKRKLVINELQKATTEKENIEMKLKHKTTVIEASSSTNQPPYAEIQRKAAPDVPSKPEDLVNLNSPLTIGYNEIELEPDDSKQALPANPLGMLHPQIKFPKQRAPTLSTRT